jgi:hypothetical protein
LAVAGDHSLYGTTSGTFSVTTTGGATTNENIRATGASSTIGYGTGSGGTVTQATSKSTAVTLNKATGVITMNGAALAASTTVLFSLNNSLIAVADVLVIGESASGSTSTPGAYQVWCNFINAGGATIAVRNITGGSLSETLVLNFAVIKGASS